MDFKLCVPCLLGLEAPIADELKRLGMANVASENRRVYFTGDESAVACANINLRVGERVLVELGRFNAVTFEELFQGVKAIRWEDIIPRDGAFPVKGTASIPRFLRVRLPEDHQEGDRGAAARRIRDRLVPLRSLRRIRCSFR